MLIFIQVLAWQTSWWTDKDHDIVPKGNVVDQLHLMLEELEDILGKERVRCVYMFICLLGGACTCLTLSVYCVLSY
jgi:hypothetical protein